MVEMEMEEGKIESWKQLKEIFDSLKEGEELIICDTVFKKRGNVFSVREGLVFTLSYTVTRAEAIDIAWNWIKQRCNEYIKIKK